MSIYTLVAVFILGSIIFFHELGHFAVAKKMGVKVKEFALGFGSKIISRRRGETEYSLRLIPLGGFVSMAEKDSGETGKTDSWNSQPVMERFAIIVAGPLMNFLLGLVLFTLVFFVYWGVPTPLAQVGQVFGRAAEAGLQIGDTIVMVNAEPVQDWQQATGLIGDSLEVNPGKKIEMIVSRNGERQSISVLPEKDCWGIACIGIEEKSLKFRLLPSIYEAATTTALIIGLSYMGLVEMLAGIGVTGVEGGVLEEIVGPVGIVGMLATAGDQMGILHLLPFAAVMSIAVGLFNLLPIPGLDGSQLIFSLLEVIRGRPDPKKEAFMKGIGSLLLILVMVMIIYQDIARLFS